MMLVAAKALMALRVALVALPIWGKITQLGKVSKG